MRRVFSLVLLVGLLTAPTIAQRTYSFETVTVGSSAVQIAQATLANMATCSARLAAAEVRYRLDGTAPTSSVGTLLYVGDVIEFADMRDARAAQFIRTGSTSGVLTVQCWSR